MTTPYASLIRECLARAGHLGTDPAHVEAFMRCEHPTLDGLTPAKFRSEVLVCAEAVAMAGAEESRKLAESFGLVSQREENRP